MTHVTHVGLDRHIENDPNQAQTHDDNDEKESQLDPNNVPQVSQVSQLSATDDPGNEALTLARKGKDFKGSNWYYSH
jgi:hypothetical protein